MFPRCSTFAPESFLSYQSNEPLQTVSSDGATKHLRLEITLFGESERLLFIRDISAAVRLQEKQRDFVANVSHELRTPLTVISGYLSAMQGNPDDLPERYIKPMQQMLQQRGATGAGAGPQAALGAEAKAQ